MADHVKSVCAIGIHGRYDLRQDFREGVNILHGKNGAGKTTFLHILSNILNADYRRFAHLKFKSIEVDLNDSTKIVLKRFLDNQEYKIEVLINTQSILCFTSNPKTAQRKPLRLQKGLFDETEEISKEESSLAPILQAAYFPAFRELELNRTPRDNVNPTNISTR